MIKWKPQQDNYIEGVLGDTKFYIRLSKTNLVTALYIIRNEEKQKIMPDKHTTIEEIKKVASQFTFE